MSRQKPPAVDSLDGANPSKPMTLVGLVKTTKGYATATALFDSDGSLVKIALGRSQSEKVYAAMEHKREMLRWVTRVDQ